MPRRVFNLARTLALFLVLGAIVNIAVAWGCAAWCGISATRISETLLIDDFALWRAVTKATWCAERRHWEIVDMINSKVDADTLAAMLPWWRRLIDERASALGQTRLEPPRWGSYQTGLSSKLPILEGLSEDARGWPFLALWGTFGSSKTSGIELSNQVGEPNIKDSRRFLPLRPIWPGFALNTLFYATILFALIHGPLVARRALRRRRGLCVACGYDLRGRGAAHLICPECGASNAQVARLSESGA